jgi:prepilin-type processing-associated H-X9-DG protein
LRTVCPRCSADNPGNAEHCNECGLDLHPDRGHERAAGIRKDKDTVIVAGVLKKKPTLSAGMLAAAVGALIIVWIPVVLALKKRSQFKGCQSNLKKLSLAMQVYARDNGGHAPTASDWTPALLPYLRDRNVLICPSRPGKIGYAFNLALNEVPLAQITNTGVVIAFFEGGDGKENANGFQSQWLASSAHSRGSNLAFADGTVRQSLSVPAAQYWTPKMKVQPTLPSGPGGDPTTDSSGSPGSTPETMPSSAPLPEGMSRVPTVPTAPPAPPVSPEASPTAPPAP